MTAFTFMQNAFYMLIGIVCIALAVLIVYGVIVGFIRAARGRNDDK